MANNSVSSSRAEKTDGAVESMEGIWTLGITLRLSLLWQIYISNRQKKRVHTPMVAKVITASVRTSMLSNSISIGLERAVECWTCGTAGAEGDAVCCPSVMVVSGVRSVSWDVVVIWCSNVGCPVPYSGKSPIIGSTSSWSLSAPAYYKLTSVCNIEHWQLLFF